MINVSHLYKSFGYRKVLRDVNLAINEGEVVALIGRNGAGKTTLVRILSTLTRADRGNISINTQDDPSALRAQIGAVLHSSMLYPNLTCRENLRFYGRLYGIANADQRIDLMLKTVDLTSRADDRLVTLSRGMQQRLSIARAMLHDPAFYLLDEVYTGLDQSFSESLDNLLLAESKSKKAILFTTHDPERVFKIATRVDILHDGRIVFTSPVSSLTPSQLGDLYRQYTAEPLKASLG